MLLISNNKAMIKNNLFFFFSFFVSVCYSQVPLEYQLSNDDNKEYRLRFINEGFSQDEVESLIQIEEKQRVINYETKESKLTRNTEIKTCNTPDLCIITSSNDNSVINLGFEGGSYKNWCRETGIFDGYTKDYDNQSPTSETGYDRNFVNHELDTDKNTIYCGNQYDNDDILDDANNSECQLTRFKIINPTDTVDKPWNEDPYVQLKDNIYGTYAIRLGNTCRYSRIDKIENTFKVTENNRKIQYTFSAILEDTDVCDHISYEGVEEEDCKESTPPIEHPVYSHSKPYFRIYLKHNGEKIECSEYMVFGDERRFDFEKKNNPGDPLIIGWKTKYLDLDAIENIKNGDDVSVIVESSDCGWRGHYGYAYFDSKFIDEIPDQGNDDNVSISVSNNKICLDDTVEFEATGGTTGYVWYIYDYSSGSAVLLDEITKVKFSYKFEKSGYYIIKYIDSNINNVEACVGKNSNKLEIDVEDCKENPCEDCDSFSPDQGKTYWLSAWVKEDVSNQITTYKNSAVELLFSDKNNKNLPENTKIRLKPSGNIIDGWQRIIGTFNIPEGAIFLNIELLNLNTTNVYFDDVRVHPYNSNMKSFAYDSDNYRLMSELDENNFATFYEYDQEGGLIRVKKETEKGVFTIQETRSKSPIIESK